eukprot:6192855-Prymnesium_polylepis.1
MQNSAAQLDAPSRVLVAQLLQLGDVLLARDQALLEEPEQHRLGLGRRLVGLGAHRQLGAHRERGERDGADEHRGHEQPR